MLTTSTRRVFIALMFTIIMTGFFWISANANPVSADSVEVVVQAENANGGFILEPTQISVDPGYAATINSSYTNASPATSNTVTALDVLFAAHTYLYGSNFNSSSLSNYIDGSASYITKMFGLSAGSGYDFPAIMFAVNGMQPRDETDPNHQFEGWGANGPATGYWTYAMNQSVLEDDDVVNFFFINAYSDQYAFLRKGTTDYIGFDPLNSTLFSTSNTLYLMGYEYFNYGYLAQSGWGIAGIENAVICKVSDGSTVGSTDENGLMTFDNDLPSGTYQLIAKSTTTSPRFISVFFTIVKP